MENLNNYSARCFKDLNGRYLTLEESDKSVVSLKAKNEDEALEQLAEKDTKDSELTIEERWNVHFIS